MPPNDEEHVTGVFHLEAAFVKNAQTSKIPDTDAEEKRLKKQREDKQRFRAKRKSIVSAMHAQVQVLENEYRRLYGGQVSEQHRALSSCLHDLDIQCRYQTTRAEVESLRRQNTVMTHQIALRIRFAALLDGYRMEFERPQPHGPPRNLSHDSFAPLSEEECDIIVQKCCETICQPISQFRGRRLSSGTYVLGWSDERWADDTTLQFTLEKVFPFVSARHLLDRSWALMTQEIQPIPFIYKPTDLVVLQVVSPEKVVVRVRYSWMHTDVMVTLLVFWMKTSSGYIVVYKSINCCDSPATSYQCRQLEQQSNHHYHHRGVWPNVLVWNRFEEQQLLPTNAFVAAESVLPSLYPMGAAECRVGCSGRIITNSQETANLLSVNIICNTVRWGQVMAGSPFHWGSSVE